jgi:hypothetical protein
MRMEARMVLSNIFEPFTAKMAHLMAGYHSCTPNIAAMLLNDWVFRCRALCTPERPATTRNKTGADPSFFGASAQSGTPCQVTETGEM